MPAAEFARRRRRKPLWWATAGTAAILVLGLVVYWFVLLPVTAEDAYRDATRLFGNGKYGDALEAATRASRDRGHRRAALELRSSIFQALDRPQDALADISRAIDMQPDGAGNRRVRARMYLDAGDVPKALEDYTRLIALENSAAAYNGRGTCYMRLNLPARAVEDFTRAIEREPSVESYLQRGLVRASTGNDRAAVADLDRAIELGPTVSATYRARASSRERLGDAEGAANDRAMALSLERPPPLKVEQVEVPKEP